MEASYRKIFFIISITGLLAMGFSLALNAQKSSEANKIKVEGIRIPIYQEGKDIPILVLTGEEAKPIGVRVEMKGVKLVWYGNTMKDIKGTVETPVAVYDRSSKTVAGNKKISYRSKEVDINGVGFDIDQEKKLLHIRSEVEVILKGDLSSIKQQRLAKEAKTGKSSKLSLVPTTEKGLEESKKNNKKSGLKNLLNNMQMNNQKVKEKN